MEASKSDADVNKGKVGRSGKKICCSCPDTKQARDECVVENGPEKCADVIEAHKQCLRSEGFTIR